MHSPSGAIRLPHQTSTGAGNMELDAALLRWARAGPDRLVYRTYSWEGPTLSLGRAEPFPEGWDLPAIARDGIDVVRRPTGGDAVLHEEELTFAVAASVPGPWRLTPRGVADAVAAGLAAALASVGLEAACVPRANGAGRAPRPGSAPCFAHAAPGEVRARGFKVAGIAARFDRGAVLCHASVPLSARHRDVARYRRSGAADRTLLELHARSVSELLGSDVASERLAESLAAALAERFGVELRPAEGIPLGVGRP